MNRIKEMRLEGKITQEEVSKILGITRSAYGHYEQGLRDIPPDVYIKLADFYGVTVDYLLGRAPTYEERNSGVADYILTPDKQELLMYYEEMTPNERDTLLNYAKFLTSQKTST